MTARKWESMHDHNGIERRIEAVHAALLESGYFGPQVLAKCEGPASVCVGDMAKLQRALASAHQAQYELGGVSRHLHEQVVLKVLQIHEKTDEPAYFDQLATLLGKTLTVVDGFKREPGFVSAYGELFSLYILTLLRSNGPGRESPIIRMILQNLTRRKAIELDRDQLHTAFEHLRDTVTVALIAKRYAVYVMAVRGLEIIFRTETSYQSFGKSPENLAQGIISSLEQHGISLAEVTEIVCGGGDVGALPGGMYVLDTKILQESRKRLANSSLNRGALVGFQLKELLTRKGNRSSIRLSLAGPLSFTTPDLVATSPFSSNPGTELTRSLRGYVKLTPLKSIASVLSEIQRVSHDDLNLLVMCLDELFASAVRKTGPRIIREMAAQAANETLNRYDFEKIRQSLAEEGFSVPDYFRLASREIGTGVKEICELLMIMDSGGISKELVQDLEHVVDTYARRVANILESASTGAPEERPHYVVLTSMMARDPYFLNLFGKIRERMDNPFTPFMCMDSLEHEYLVAKHLFETHINPEGDRRLVFSVESSSLRRALQVLRSVTSTPACFSFESLLDAVANSIEVNKIEPGKICLVGADNEDALIAAFNAMEYQIVKRLVLIGDEDEILRAAERNKLPLRSKPAKEVHILPIERNAGDFETKNWLMAKVFRDFLEHHADYMVMKGSLRTASVMHEALSIYKKSLPGSYQAQQRRRRIASLTALFVLPDGRFFALSDPAVNPSFTRPADLLTAMENQVEVVRKVVHRDLTLKVAIITAVEKQTSAIPATLLAHETMRESLVLQDRYSPMIVEGPLSFDLATAPEVAEEKRYEGRIRGDANCLLATDINTANVLYKMLTKTMGSLGLVVSNGSIVTAGPGTIPIVLTSRGDTAQTKFNSILLALAYQSL